MSELDRLSALEQRVLELETEVAALTALLLLVLEPDPSTREDVSRAFAASAARWRELDREEIRRVADEILRAAPGALRARR